MKKLRGKLKIKSLKWQLLFRFCMILIVLLSIMGIFQYISMKEYLYRTKVQVLQQKFHNIDLRHLSEGELLDSSNSDSTENLNKLKDKNMSLAIIDKNGDQIVGINNVDYIKEEIYDGDIENGQSTKEYNKHKVIVTMSVPVLSEESYIGLLNEEGNLEKDHKVVKDENNNLELVAWRKIGDMSSPSGLIQLSISIEDCVDILNRQVYMHISFSILILIIGAILGTAIFNRTLKPLYNITNTVEGIDVTELDKRLPEESGQLEIDRLSKSFNIMLKRIEASFQKEQDIKEKMRQFVSDASHELRTPLTSIHGFVEVLLRGAAKNEEQLDLALNSILTESERLTKLVNDLLVLTKLEQNPTVELNKENINNVIEEIFPQLQILTKDRTLHLEPKENVIVHINKDQIKQVIFNITQNSVLHTDKKNGIITISTEIEKLKDETFGVLRISDNGTGIPEKHLNKIYDRFFRSDAHRSREYGGYGLGLSIVKSIIDSNNGEIKVESEVGVGTTFSVYLKMEK